MPPDFWGEVEPSDSGVLPTNRDSSAVDGNVNPTFVSRWVSVSPVSDSSGDWLFAATGYHLQIWNLSDDPDAPSRVGNETLAASGIQAAVTGHTPLIFSSIRTAPGNSNLFAVGGTSSAGVSILRSTNKQDPSLLFQDELKEVSRVYTADIGGSTYVFAAGDLVNAGVRAYNMTAANGLGSPCLANLPTSNPCPGVHVGAVGAPAIKRATGVDGVGNFLAVSTVTGFAPGGFHIFNVSDPANPVLLMSGLVGTKVFGIAMWQEGGSYYVAVRSQTNGAIYNVSCIANGACSAPGSPTWSAAMADSTIPTVTVSRSNGIPVLYWARGLFCGSAANRELLQDVRNASNPVSLMSPSYFSHYYWDSETGFNFFAPTEGAFLGSHFYRAAYSVLDVHRWGAGNSPPPVATIGSVSASPNPASTCQDVTFTGNNVTNGFGATYIWQVRTGPQSLTLVDSASGTDLNPFVWETESVAPGQYSAFLAVQNASGPSVPKQSVVVTVTAVGQLPGAGTFAPTKFGDSSGAVTFDVVASGASEWSWDFGEGAGFGPWISDPINGPHPTFVYSATGSKTVKVQVRNCAAGPVTSSDLVIDVPVVNPLVANFSFSACAFQLPGPICATDSGLNFVDHSTGAQTWDYDWDCQQSGVGCNSFEQSGNSSPVTSHTYNSAGIYTPQLRVKRDSGEHVFKHSAITISGGSSSTPTPTPTPTPFCGDGTCNNGETNSSCSADCGSGPICGDLVCSVGENCPKDCLPPPWPSIGISGPSAGQTNIGHDFAAAASNCFPSPNGWVWTHTGVGVSTTNFITITWANGGNKTITVTNSGCPGAFDDQPVVIGGGSSLIAAFNAQVSGLTVSLNAGTSSGSPTSYDWNFGDGQTGTGMTTQHTYAHAGTYSIVLSVSKACATGTCSDEKSSQVGVGGGGGTVTPTPTPNTPTPTPTPTQTPTSPLVAAFTAQVNGMTVNLNAASSQGSPTGYLWNFGDGQTGEGVTTQHTYAAVGSYTVVLAVSKQSTGCTFGVCNAEKSSVVQVGGAGTPTPTPTPPPGGGLCVPDGDTFCALDGDFQIEVTWKKKNGETGVGHVVPAATSENTGIFYYFDSGNWELLLKVLDACSINQRFWVFGGAATNVEYQIKVTDLVTDDVWIYDNPQGKSSDAITDTSAFATCTVDRNLMRENARAELAARICVGCPGDGGPTNPTPTPTPSPTPTVPVNVGPCDPNSTTLCAISERFQVRVSWETKSGSTGNGAVVPATTDNTGVFWFFQQQNWELLIKVLNGCGVNNHFWVFGAGATDVNYTVKVDDLQTGATWEYENAQGHASPAITDTTAFETCTP